MSVPQTVFLAFGVIGLSIIISIVIYKRKKINKPPKIWKEVGTIKNIHLYPLKSGKKIELTEAKVTKVGIKQTKYDANGNIPLSDRVLMVYGADDRKFRNARTNPKLVLIETKSTATSVIFDAPNAPTLSVEIPEKTATAVSIMCCDDEMIEGIDCGAEAALWFTKYLGSSEIRLAYHHMTKKRDITEAQNDILGYYKKLNNDSTGLFSDLTSASLISIPSVNDLNDLVGDGSKITPEQFRHNFIVDGLNLEAYSEDDWDWIKIGPETVFRNVKDCTRCIATIVDPITGVRNNQRQPLKSLEQNRQSPGPEKLGKIGVHLEVVTTGIIKVGDLVYVGLND